MKVLKNVGFIIVTIGIILGLYQGYLLILTYLFDNMDIDRQIAIIRPILLSTMLVGFLLIITGGTLEGYLSKKEESEPINRPKKGIVRNRVYVVDGFIGVLINIPLIILVVTYSDFFVPHEVKLLVDVLSIAAIVWIATSLPLYVDKINRDTLEINFSGRIHIHESFLGILFIITGFIFIFHHIIPFDFVYGSYYLIIGSFLMGRDIEDLRQFKIIERVSKE